MIVESTRWVRAEDARLGTLADGKLLRVVVKKRALAFVRIAGALRAMEDRCPHQGRALSGGWVEDGHVVCPFHRFHYDPATGACKHALTGHVAVYAVRETAGRIEVGLPYTTLSVFGWKLW